MNTHLFSLIHRGAPFINSIEITIVMGAQLVEYSPGIVDEINPYEKKNNAEVFGSKKTLEVELNDFQGWQVLERSPNHLGERFSDSRGLRVIGRDPKISGAISDLGTQGLCEHVHLTNLDELEISNPKSAILG